ncbi:MAG: hypothetical protein FWB86_09225 [Treponema sp.]|nr:hypothetical protein [Treponema sp.]MCL2251251.1 hypothetical protein [Treponema sp.]
MKKILKISVLLLAMGLILNFAGCDLFGEKSSGGGEENIPDWAKGLYNYPTGRVSQNGTLTINNTIASEVLLFEGKVEKDNYIGTINSLGTIKVRMPDQKFYTIIGVNKANYAERGAQAAQFNELTYYSDTQAYTISVSPSSTWGGGNWVFDNNTIYWVEVKKSDLSSNYAVIAPGAKRVIVPVEIGPIYDYYLYFKRELKYDGKVVALVDFEDRSQARSVQATNSEPTITTDIKNSDTTNTNTKPALLVINSSDQGLRVHSGSTLLTNGSPSGDFIVRGGRSDLISGFDINANTTAINFRALSWTAPRYVPASQEMQMKSNKIYELSFPKNEDASAITILEVEASKYYQ